MIGMGGAILALQTAIRCSLESSYEFLLTMSLILFQALMLE